MWFGDEQLQVRCTRMCCDAPVEVITGMRRFYCFCLMVCIQVMYVILHTHLAFA